jgi:hypothetical protein
MEFADWIVSGLDQLRAGNLPGGQALYQTVSGGLGGHPAVDAFMNTGDPAARAQLVQLITQATVTNPGFEQQLRAAAASAQGGGGGSVGGGVGGPVKTPFLKTSNGIVVLVVAAVLVVGGGVGLAFGLSGSSSKSSSGAGGTSGGSSGGSGGNVGGGTTSFAKTLEGTWTCAAGKITIGDGTWSVGADSGTWTQSGGKATVTSKNNPGQDISATNVPTSGGAFDIVATGGGSSANTPTHIKGLVSAHELNVQVSVPGSDVNPALACNR